MACYGMGMAVNFFWLMVLITVIIAIIVFIRDVRGPRP